MEVYNCRKQKNPQLRKIVKMMLQSPFTGINPWGIPLPQRGAQRVAICAIAQSKISAT